MEITSDFSLPLAADDAYRLLLDLDRVAPCLPGATLGAEAGGGERELTLTMRLGPMRFAYGGTIAISEQDAQRRRAVLVGAAREKRGQGTARATITMEVAPDGPAGATVTSTAQVELTGRAAQTGRGIVEDVSRQMIGEMARCLAATCEPASGSVPAGGAGAAQDGQPVAAGAADGGTPTATAGGAARPVAAGTAPAPAPAPARQEIRAGRLLARIAWQRLLRLLGRDRAA